MKEPQKILEELIGSKPEELTGEAKRLFEAIMKIADERDELLKERQADKEKIKELESDNYECNNIIREYIEDWELKTKMIELMLEKLTDCEFEMKCSECCCECEKDYDQLYECNKQYFENKAKESGEIDDKRI